MKLHDTTYIGRASQQLQNFPSQNGCQESWHRLHPAYPRSLGFTQGPRNVKYCFPLKAASMHVSRSYE